MSSLMAAPSAGKITTRQQLIGTVSLLSAYLLLQLPFRIVVRTVALLDRGAVRASAADGQLAVAVVRNAARWFPGRAACLETSLGAVLAARLHGRRLDWCIGARQLPYAAHAWVEAEGQPIDEPPDRRHLLLLRV